MPKQGLHNTQKLDSANSKVLRGLKMQALQLQNCTYDKAGSKRSLLQRSPCVQVPASQSIPRPLRPCACETSCAITGVQNTTYHSDTGWWARADVRLTACAGPVSEVCEGFESAGYITNFANGVVRHETTRDWMRLHFFKSGFCAVLL